MIFQLREGAGLASHGLFFVEFSMAAVYSKLGRKVLQRA